MASISLLIVILVGSCFNTYRKRKNDEMWHVNPEELNFSHPAEVIGQGAFGVVLAAEYRGTRVAIKRVVPLNKEPKALSRGSSVVSALRSSGRISGADLPLASEREENADPEAGTNSPMTSDTDSHDVSIRESSVEAEIPDFFGGLPVGAKKSFLRRWFPYFFHGDFARSNVNLLGTASGVAPTQSIFAMLCPSCDETSQRHQDFLVEMRLLSRLRHPCKYLESGNRL